MNKRFCQTCGSELQPVSDYTAMWISVYECANSHHGSDYMEVGDSRLVFPLQMLSFGVKQKLLSSSAELVKLAVSRIKTIDYKTVSIVGFEQTLLGTYRSEDGHRDGTRV